MEKINISELLRDCPTGMELDCVMYQDVYFDYVDTLNIIHCYIQHNTHKSSITFNQYGTPNSDIKSKCVIFPKGKTTWEGFQSPFKDGDIIYNRLRKKICIYYLFEDEVPRIKGCRYNESNPQLQFEKLEYPIPIAIQDYRLATGEEQVKLFKAIENNGYRWNEKAKTLEKLIKPIFKKGDKVRVKKGFPEPRIARIIEDVCDTFYTLVSVGKIDFTDQDNWELVPNKFEISRLKPFDEVLVRNSNNGKWRGQFYMAYNKNEDYPFECTYNCWMQCIPYKGNEHLLNTTDACNNYFKTWEE